MRIASSLPRIAALALLSGCAPAALSTTTPTANLPAATSRVHGVTAPASARRGIYVSFEQAVSRPAIYGYRQHNRKNKPPICTAMPYIEGADIAVNDSGNLMIATAGEEELFVLQGPGMCGPPLGKIYTVGVAFDVASADAANGEIVVGNLYGNSGLGDIVVCTLSAGCTKTLTNSSIEGLYGIAVARNGDCWASASGTASNPTVLVYFKHCSGSGQVASGYTNKSPGGLDIDKHGNLVSLDGVNGEISVYEGCRPACTLIGGPFSAHGYAYYGHLNRNSTEFAAADYQYGQVDIYKYTPTKITYEYSFNNGINASEGVIGAAYAPRSKE